MIHAHTVPSVHGMQLAIEATWATTILRNNTKATREETTPAVKHFAKPLYGDQVSSG